MRLGKPPTHENIPDLTNTDDLATCLGKCLQKRCAGRFNGKIVAVGGAAEVPCLTDKGTGNDASHTMLAYKQLAGDTAIAVQLLKRNQLLVGGDLKHAVRRGVDDEVARAKMLLAVVGDDLGARIGQIANDASSRATGKLVKKLLREAIGIGGKGLFRY